ncbi:hypothetical protein FRC02_003306 [Tulasnella sp. 418]|nr:hypothetical protein FRC02_003306 [Tulasnella sp. 418]
MRTTAPTPVVIRVPRHGTVAPSAEVLEVAQRIAAKEGIPLKDKNVVDPHSLAGEGAANASEWNSMLLTARAMRGPQWDVATQQFQVDKESHLYYDPSPLTGGGDSQNQSGEGHTPGSHMSPTSSHHQTPSASGGTYGELNLNQGMGMNHLTATPSPVPSRYDFEGRRRLTRGSSGRDGMY